MTIVNVRGPNGSGKTTLVRKVLEHRTHTVVGPEYLSKTSKKPQYWPLHVCATPVGTVVVHGRYDVQQGGVDTEKDMDAADQQLRLGFQRFPEHHHIFEGFIVSKSGKRFLSMARDVLRELPGQSWHWVFLDVPLEECERRIMERNGGKAPKRALLETTFKSVNSTRRLFSQAAVGKVSRFPGSVDDPWGFFDA